MSALEAELERLIGREGPLPLSRFMTEALAHPKHGYYMHRDPLGQRGDFTTAPEISGSPVRHFSPCSRGSRDMLFSADLPIKSVLSSSTNRPSPAS